MRTPRRAVELEVETWRIEEAGFTSGPYLGRFELLWPRPNIERSRIVLGLPDRIGETVDWSEAPLRRKWLFKEDMEGRMVLAVTVLPLRDRNTPEVGGEALDLIGRSVARETSLAWRTLSDLIDLGGSAARYILAGPQKTIAEGDVLIEEQVDRTHRIPLVAPHDLYRPGSVRSEPSGPRTDLETGETEEPEAPDRIAVEAGEDNGYLDVKMTVWDE